MLLTDLWLGVRVRGGKEEKYCHQVTQTNCHATCGEK